MTAKKKKLPRRVRLSSFQRALRDAELRLEKATLEHAHCLEKLAELNIEIPYLEGILRALNPNPAEEQRIDRNTLNSLYAQAKASAPEPDVLPPTDRLNPAAAPLDQAQFLQRFMPRPGRLTTPVGPPQPQQPQPGSSPDPDEFLTADNDRGYEVLP